MTSKERVLAVIRAAENGIRSRHLCLQAGVGRKWTMNLCQKLAAEGEVQVVGMGVAAVWCVPEKAREIRAMQAKQSKMLEKARRERKFTAAPDMPVVHRIVQAGELEPPSTQAPRTVFEYRP